MTVLGFVDVNQIGIRFAVFVVECDETGRDFSKIFDNFG